MKLPKETMEPSSLSLILRGIHEGLYDTRCDHWVVNTFFSFLVA